MKVLNRGLIAGILLATIVFTPADLPSCGPFFPEAVFTETRMPPLSDYVQGRLGVIHSTFTSKYLFIAYRYLSGQPLTMEEAARINTSPEAASEAEPGYIGGSSPVKEWLDIRGKTLNESKTNYIDVYRNDTSASGNGWRYFLNCTDDAFKAAANTLNARIKALGSEHPGVKSWISAQDAVFSNCSKGKNIPAQAEAALPPILKYDRAYQIAAANFYAEQYDEAAKMFQEIAADRNSPWSPMAPYLVVRCLIRKATVPQKYRTFDRNALQEAARVLHEILQDNTRASLHSIAAKLEAFVTLRLNPTERLRALTEKLRQRSTRDDFGQDAVDYLYLLTHPNLQPDFTPENIRKTGDLTDWIQTISSADATHALQRWKAAGSEAWLVAAIMGLHIGNPDMASMMDAVTKIPKNSPAFPTAQYHRIRLLMESGKANEARAELDMLLPTLRASLQNSSLNAFLAQRLQLAKDFDEFLEFSPRIPQIRNNEEEGYDFSEQELKEYAGSGTSLFDADSVKILNRGVPLSYLSRAATGKLPAHLKKLLLRATWVRAALISDNATAIQLADELVRAFPELKPDLDAWLAAKGIEVRQFALAMLLMHFPGTNPYLQSGLPRRTKLDGIDNLRENWWCGFSASADLEQPTGFRFNSSNYQEQGKLPEPAELPSFLSDADRVAFKTEWAKLSALPTAPNYFGKIALSWAEKNPKDGRVPEALSLVVKSTRFGCTDLESGQYSRRAFRLLHSRYPETPWAKSTPYWFQ